MAHVEPSGPDLSASLNDLMAAQLEGKPDTPPAEAPPAAPAPSEPAATPDAPAPAAPAEPAPSPSSALFGEQEPVVGDDIVYRDAKGLREDVAKARETYKPIHDALGQVPEAYREAIVTMAPAHTLADNNPALAADVAYLQAVWPQLAPTDQEWIKERVALIGRSPAWVAQELAEAASTLRGDSAPAPTGPRVEEPNPFDDDDDDDEFETNDPNRPMTVAEFTRMQAEQAAQRSLDEQTQTFYREMHAELVGLGYAPDSTDKQERARVAAITAIAEELPDGNLTAAHEILSGWNQKAVDDYVAERRADAQRQGPPDGGAPPSLERVIEEGSDDPLKAAERAMNARLDAVYGAQGAPQR